MSFNGCAILHVDTTYTLYLASANTDAARGTAAATAIAALATGETPLLLGLPEHLISVHPALVTFQPTLRWVGAGIDTTILKSTVHAPRQRRDGGSRRRIISRSSTSTNLPRPRDGLITVPFSCDGRRLSFYGWRASPRPSLSAGSDGIIIDKDSVCSLTLLDCNITTNFDSLLITDSGANTQHVIKASNTTITMTTRCVIQQRHHWPEDFNGHDEFVRMYCQFDKHEHRQTHNRTSQ